MIFLPFLVRGILLAGFTANAAVILHLGTVLHHTFLFALALFVTEHLLLGLVLFAFYAHKIGCAILTSPSTTAPIVGRQLVLGAFDTSRTRTIALLAFGIALLDGHVGIAKTDDLGLAIGTGSHH